MVYLSDDEYSSLMKELKQVKDELAKVSADFCQLLDTNSQLQQILQSDRIIHNETKNKLKEKNKLFHFLAGNAAKVKQKCHLKKIRTLAKTLEKVYINTNVCATGISSVNLLLQSNSQDRDNAKEEIKYLKEKCDELTNKETSFSFVIQQLNHKIDDLKTELNSVKAETVPLKRKREVQFMSELPLTPDSAIVDDEVFSLHEKPLYQGNVCVSGTSHSTPESSSLTLVPTCKSIKNKSTDAKQCDKSRRPGNKKNTKKTKKEEYTNVGNESSRNIVNDECKSYKTKNKEDKATFPELNISGDDSIMSFSLKKDNTNDTEISLINNNNCNSLDGVSTVSKVKIVQMPDLQTDKMEAFGSINTALNISGPSVLMSREENTKIKEGSSISKNFTSLIGISTPVNKGGNVYSMPDLQSDEMDDLEINSASTVSGPSLTMSRENNTKNKEVSFVSKNNNCTSLNGISSPINKVDSSHNIPDLQSDEKDLEVNAVSSTEGGPVVMPKEVNTNLKQVYKNRHCTLLNGVFEEVSTVSKNDSYNSLMNSLKNEECPNDQSVCIENIPRVKSVFSPSLESSGISFVPPLGTKELDDEIYKYYLVPDLISPLDVTDCIFPLNIPSPVYYDLYGLVLLSDLTDGKISSILDSDVSVGLLEYQEQDISKENNHQPLVAAVTCSMEAQDTNGTLLGPTTNKEATPQQNEGHNVPKDDYINSCNQKSIIPPLPILVKVCETARGEIKSQDTNETLLGPTTNKEATPQQHEGHNKPKDDYINSCNQKSIIPPLPISMEVCETGRDEIKSQDTNETLLGPTTNKEATPQQHEGHNMPKDDYISSCNQKSIIPPLPISIEVCETARDEIKSQDTNEPLLGPTTNKEATLQQHEGHNMPKDNYINSCNQKSIIPPLPISMEECKTARDEIKSKDTNETLLGPTTNKEATPQQHEGHNMPKDNYINSCNQKSIIPPLPISMEVCEKAKDGINSSFNNTSGLDNKMNFIQGSVYSNVITMENRTTTASLIIKTTSPLLVTQSLSTEEEEYNYSHDNLKRCPLDQEQHYLNLSKQKFKFDYLKKLDSLSQSLNVHKQQVTPPVSHQGIKSKENQTHVHTRSPNGIKRYRLRDVQLPNYSEIDYVNLEDGYGMESVFECNIKSVSSEFSYDELAPKRYKKICSPKISPNSELKRQSGNFKTTKRHSPKPKTPDICTPSVSPRSPEGLQHYNLRILGKRNYSLNDSREKRGLPPIEAPSEDVMFAYNEVLSITIPPNKREKFNICGHERILLECPLQTLQNNERRQSRNNQIEVFQPTSSVNDSQNMSSIVENEANTAQKFESSSTLLNKSVVEAKPTKQLQLSNSTHSMTTKETSTFVPVHDNYGMNESCFRGKPQQNTSLRIQSSEDKLCSHVDDLKDIDLNNQCCKLESPTLRNEVVFSNVDKLLFGTIHYEDGLYHHTNQTEKNTKIDSIGKSITESELTQSNANITQRVNCDENILSEKKKEMRMLLRKVKEQSLTKPLFNFNNGDDLKSDTEKKEFNGIINSKKICSKQNQDKKKQKAELVKLGISQINCHKNILETGEVQNIDNKFLSDSSKPLLFSENETVNVNKHGLKRNYSNNYSKKKATNFKFQKVSPPKTYCRLKIEKNLKILNEDQVSLVQKATNSSNVPDCGPSESKRNKFDNSKVSNQRTTKKQSLEITQHFTSPLNYKTKWDVRNLSPTSRIRLESSTGIVSVQAVTHQNELNPIAIVRPEKHYGTNVLSQSQTKFEVSELIENGITINDEKLFDKAKPNDVDKSTDEFSTQHSNATNLKSPNVNYLREEYQYKKQIEQEQQILEKSLCLNDIKMDKSTDEFLVQQKCLTNLKSPCFKYHQQENQCKKQIKQEPGEQQIIETPFKNIVNTSFTSSDHMLTTPTISSDQIAEQDYGSDEDVLVVDVEEDPPCLLETAKDRTIESNAHLLYISPHPVPSEMCRYSVPLVKTNLDFSSLKTHVLNSKYTSTQEVAKDKEIDKTSVSKRVFPNFYRPTEMLDQSNVEINKNEKTELNECVVYTDYHKYESVSFVDVIPKGNKIPMIGNILITANRHMCTNIKDFTERNAIEKRIHSLPKVSAETAQKVAVVLRDVIVADVKNVAVLSDAADKLVMYDVAILLRGLIILLNDVVKKSRTKKIKQTEWIECLEYFPFEPNPRILIHPRIKVFVSLFFIINSKKHNCPPKKSTFFREALDFIKDVFFNKSKDDLPGIVPYLAYTYTCLARLSGELATVQDLLFQALYCLSKTSLTLSCIILRTWPAVLRVQPIEVYQGDPLALVVLHALATGTSLNLMENSFNSSYCKRLQQMLRTKYMIQADTLDPDQLVDRFLNRLSQKNVEQAFILLAKRRGMKWFLKKPFGQLMSVVSLWREGKKTAIEAVTALNILCSITRSLEQATSRPALRQLFDLLKDLLLNKSTPSWMQETVAVNLCRLSRLDLVTCTSILVSWTPHEVSAEVIDRVLTNIIGRRSQRWWFNRNGGLIYLNKK